MQLFGIQKRSGETYLDLYRHVDNAHSRIDCITPTNQSCKDRSNEIALFTLLSALHTDDPLCRQMVSQKGITLEDAYSAFLHTDRDTAVASEIELASMAFVSHCHRCDQPGHYTRDCPHFEAITQLVGQHIGASAGSNNGNSNSSNSNNSNNTGGGWQRGRGHGSNAANANATGTSSTGNTTPTLTTQETTGVATAFLSHESHTTDNWLCDSGASSSMSSTRSAFLSLRLDRCPIRLADGKVIYSEGLGLICFLSDCGYMVVIHNVLFVPLLAVSLFASNKFARQHHNLYSEIMEYPKHKWINCQTGATEFTATIWLNDLL